MKVKLSVNCARFAIPGGRIDEIVELPDGLTDDEIDKEVNEDLQQMCAEYVEGWWERIEDGDEQ